MNTRTGKIQDQKALSVANNLPQKRGNESVARLTDNRPEAIAQRKMQEAMNNSRRIRQLKAFEQTTSSNPNLHVIQRVVDLTAGTTATQNNRYFVRAADTKVLFSLRTIAEPKPVSLYKKEDEQSTTNIPLFKWTPNVRLFTNTERTDIEGVADTSDLMRAMDRGVKNPDASGVGVRMPGKGILGKNDCKGLGGVLSIMISQEGTDNRSLVGTNMGVGDRMTHKFPMDADCMYHSATVVAEDGASLVTLEADVSKDLSRPDFTIRNGLAGFVQDNNAGADGTQKNYGDDVDISRAKGKEASRSEMNMLRGIHADYAKYDVGNWVQENQGVADTQVLLDLKANTLAKILEITNKYWGKYTSWTFTPTGVSAIKKIVTGVPPAPIPMTQTLQDAQVQAAADLVRASGDRHQATTDFYTTLAGMSVENMESLRRVIDNLNHIIGQMDAGHV